MPKVHRQKPRVHMTMTIEETMQLAQLKWGVAFEKASEDQAGGPCVVVCHSEHKSDSDRMRIFKEGNYWCRQCGSTGWLTDETGHEIDERDFRLAVVEQQVKDLQNRMSVLETMAEKTYEVENYHNALDESAVDWWHDTQGVFYESIHDYKLGFCNSCPTAPGVNSYTIPYYAKDGKLLNIRHRLKHPEGGKYRPHMKGLGIHLFNEAVLPRERVVLVEGEIKSIVLSQNGFPSVGIMGCKGFKEPWKLKFAGTKEIIIALDPEIQQDQYKIAQALDGFDVRIAEFPHKPDDMMVKYGATKGDMEWFLRQARRA